MFLKCLSIILFFLVFNVSHALGFEKVEVVIDGLEGEALSNVTEALTIPDSLMQEGQINLMWLHRFERQAGKKIKSALFNLLFTSVTTLDPLLRQEPHE